MLHKDRLRFQYSPEVNVIIFLAKQLRPTKKKIKKVSYARVSLPLKIWDKVKSARLSLPPEQLEESRASLQETLILVYKNQGKKGTVK